MSCQDMSTLLGFEFKVKLSYINSRENMARMRFEFKVKNQVNTVRQTYRTVRAIGMCQLKCQKDSALFVL